MLFLIILLYVVRLVLSVVYLSDSRGVCCSSLCILSQNLIEFRTPLVVPLDFLCLCLWNFIVFRACTLLSGSLSVHEIYCNFHQGDRVDPGLIMYGNLSVLKQIWSFGGWPLYLYAHVYCLYLGCDGSLFVPSSRHVKYGQWSDNLVWMIPDYVLRPDFDNLQYKLSMRVALDLDGLVGRVIFWKKLFLTIVSRNSAYFDRSWSLNRFILKSLATTTSLLWRFNSKFPLYGQ